MNEIINRYQIKESRLPLVLLIILGAAIGILLVALPLLTTLFALLGILFLVLSVRNPEYSLLLVVVLTSSIIFEKELPMLPIGIGSLHLADILLLGLLCTVVIRKCISSNCVFTRSPLNIPLGLFLLIAIVSTLISINYYSVDYNAAMRTFRVISYYSLFYVVLNGICTKSQIQLLIRGLFVIASIVSIAMIAQVVIGESVQLMPGRVESASIPGYEYGTLRVIPPGQTLIFVCLFIAISILTINKNYLIINSVYFINVLLLGAGVILTYNRNYWVSFISSIVLFILILPLKRKYKLASLIAMLGVISYSFIFIFSGHYNEIAETSNAVTERFSTIFTGNDVIHSQSLEDRYLENEYAVKQILQHPILGIGLGNNYRSDIFGRDDESTDYMHNALLWITTNMGILGIVSFMIYFIGFLIRGVTHWKIIKDVYLRSLSVGFLLSGIALLASSVVNPIFMQKFSIVVLSIMIGLSEVIIKINTAD